MGVSLLACLVFLIFVVASNSYFIRSIVDPVLKINNIAKEIAAGRYGVRLQKTYDDEIGELCDTINYMSDEINRAERMKNDFISSVSHELRTPLTAIGGWSETLLAGGGEDPEEVMQGLTIIQKESNRLTRMVEELLDFARIESGRMKLEVETFDLSIELYEAVYMYENLLQKSGIRLNYDEDVEANYFVNGDRHRMKQVFLNILDNAAKYGADGKRIDITLGRDGGKLVATVRDYGQGIPEAELPFVKEKFYKGSSKHRSGCDRGNRNAARRHHRHRLHRGREHDRDRHPAVREGGAGARHHGNAAPHRGRTVNPQKEKPMSTKKTTIGGQAIIEGIVMKGPKKTCTVVRKAGGELVTKTEDAHHPSAFWRLPVLRGAYTLFTAMKDGIVAINYSAEFFEDEEIEEEPSGFEKWLEAKFGSEKLNKMILGLSTVIGIALPVGLFLLLPSFLGGFVPKNWGVLARNVLEGIVRIVIFLMFMWSVSHMKDIRRTFEYHGAEHKTIFCYEAGEELTVENVRKQQKYHPRCGTSFMFVLIIIATIVSSIVFSIVEVTNPFLRMLAHLILLPLVVGISYEFNRYAGRSESVISRALRWPGLMIQHLTVFEPDDSMIEVAITAMKEVIPDDGSDEW